MLTNARDAVEERGSGAKSSGVVGASTRLFEEEGSWGEVLIVDTGKGGFRYPFVFRLFDPLFFSKEVGKGTVLGLSIRYGIIKDHQGEIAVGETGV